MGSTPSEEHFHVDIDPYLGAQIEVLDGADLLVSDHFQFNNNKSIHLHCDQELVAATDGENVSIRSNRLSLTHDHEYQQQEPQVTDCFMGVGIVEEEVNGGQGSWYMTGTTMTPGVNVIPTFRDGYGHVRTMDLDQLMVADVQRPLDLDRQRKFTKGWEDMKQKIDAMNNRTGTKTSVHAVFDSVIYFMDMHNRQRPRSAGDMNPVLQGDEVSDSENSKETSVVEGDHRYAAVILTQKKSSSEVRDHQYNQLSCGSSNCQNLSGIFIKSRYKREQQLVKYLESLFLKKQTLETVTGAIITLEVSYEHFVFNSRNFKSADETLSNNRKKLFRVPVVPTVEFYTSDENQSFENYNPNLPQILMRVERVPAGGDITAGVHVRYVKRNVDKPNAAATILRSPTSPVEEESLNHKNPFTPISIDPEFLSLNLDHPYGLSPAILTSSRRNNVENSKIPSTSRPVSPQEDEMISESDSFDYSPSLNNPSTSPTNPNSPTGKNVASTTQTQPICGICGSHNNDLPPSEFWLRCFNPFCYFMVHPSCLGFRVNSSDQAAKLPPYLCPEHR